MVMATAIEESRIKYWGELADVAKALASNFSKLLRHKGKVYGNIIDGGYLALSEYTPIMVNDDISDRDDGTRLEQIDRYDKYTTDGNT
jgi:hypothetical protein